MAMAAEAPARVAETAAGQGKGPARASAVNAEAGGGHEPETGEDARWGPVLGLPCEFFVDISVPGFTIADLLKLRPGTVIDAHWRVGQDVPLRLNGALI